MTQTASPSPSITVKVGVPRLEPIGSMLSHSAVQASSDAAFSQIVEDHADLAYNIACRARRVRAMRGWASSLNRSLQWAAPSVQATEKGPSPSKG